MSGIQLETPDKLEYQFVPNDTGYLHVRVRARQDAHIALTTSPAERNPMYEIFFGSWNNSKSIIRKNRTKPDVAEAKTPGILNPCEFRGFWIRWNNTTITAGTEANCQPILTYTDSEIIPIKYIGVCTGWGATGSWIILPANTSLGYKSEPTGTLESVCWVPGSSGKVPLNAFVGGKDKGECMFVIRANFHGCLIPGKLLSSHGRCYISWGEKEHGLKDYEVLCDFKGDWVKCCKGNIPRNALAAGRSENGEPLYVRRVLHDGAITIGKVQRSHGRCYIPYGGKEFSFPEYEILVTGA